MAADWEKVRGVTDGGVSADHAPRPPLSLLAAPATRKEGNTLQARLFPLACWRVEDMRFEFDSSFVRPEIAEEMKELIILIDDHTVEETSPDGKAARKSCPVLSVFGHADPVGNDNYNKQLSGRRAQAIYALLTRRTELWEQLFSNPFGGDVWGDDAIQTMRETLGRGNQTGPTTPAQREILFSDYMKQICVDKDGNPFSVATSDFLGGGLDKGGKADFQGCGEFNPVLMFSKEESEAFKRDQDKTARNSANAPNRRVLVFLFRSGIKIDPSVWPCPRAKEGVAACKKRFWSDADKRRKFQEERREFKTHHDTFACRFYERLASNSPCEDAGERPTHHISLLLRSNSGAVPIANAKYRIEINDARTLEGVTDQDGLVLHSGVANGDYVLEIEGFDGKTTVPSLPRHVRRRLTRIPGFFLDSRTRTEALAAEGEPAAQSETPGNQG